MAYYNQIGSVEQQIKDLEKRMKTSETAPRLASSSVGSGGLSIIDGGSLNIKDGGELNVSGDTTIDGILTVGATTFLQGNTSITGDLTLNNGSIKGNALENQISASNTRATGTGWAAPSGTWTTAASVTANRPSWATQAMIIAVGTATGRTTAAGGEGTDSPLRIRMNVNGSASTEIAAVLSDSGSGSAAYFQATGTVGWSDVIDSPGATVYARVEVSSYRSVWWPASALSTASVSMQVLWLR